MQVVMFISRNNFTQLYIKISTSSTHNMSFWVYFYDWKNMVQNLNIFFVFKFPALKNLNIFHYYFIHICLQVQIVFQVCFCTSWLTPWGVWRSLCPPCSLTGTAGWWPTPYAPWCWRVSFWPLYFLSSRNLHPSWSLGSQWELRRTLRNV